MYRIIAITVDAKVIESEVLVHATKVEGVVAHLRKIWWVSEAWYMEVEEKECASCGQPISCCACVDGVPYWVREDPELYR
jgi:hypothetical protein